MVRWLIPVLVLLGAVCAVMIEQKAAGVGRAFPEDGAYGNMAVVRSLAGKWTYGMPGQTIPALGDVLWRVALLVFGWIFPDLYAASYVLGVACSVVTILLCGRLARFLFPFPPFITYTMLLVILAPPLLMDATSGTAASMATAMVTAAVALHVEGLLGRRMPLSSVTALIIGFLLWIRLEFILLWIVFWLHAFVVSLFPSERSVSPVFIVVRGITGLMIFALCLFPLLAWNYYVIRVPWPQTPGASFTLDALGGASGGSMATRYLALVTGGLAASFHRLYATPFLSGVVERVVTWFGVLFMAALGLWRREERAYTIILFLLLLLPALFALIAPLLGWQASSLVFRTVVPLCLMSAAFGIFRIPFLLESLYRKWKEGLPEAPGFNAWWIAMGSILVILSLVRSGAAVRGRIAELKESETLRAGVLQALRASGSGVKSVVTDQPGWLAYEQQLKVVDIGGEFTPEVLACLDGKGHVDADDLGRFLSEIKPDALALFRPRSEFVLTVVPCEPLEVPGADPRTHFPKVCRLNWYGAF